MGRLANYLYPLTPKKFKFIGTPAKYRGPSREISVSYLHTSCGNASPITIHCLPAYICVMYLVEYHARNEFLLLDSGSAADVRRIKYYVEEVLSRTRGRKLTLRDNLKLVVASHCHLDHSGGTLGFQKEGIPIAVPPHMDDSYAGMRGVQQLVEANFIYLIARRLKRQRENVMAESAGFFGPYWPVAPRTDLLLHDGDTLPLGFDDWSVISLPGHTTHMVGLYHTPSRCFYAADLTVKLQKGFFPPQPVHYDFAYAHTLQRIHQLHIRSLLLAHGGMVDVRKEYGSWETILENVKNNYYAIHQRYINPKDRGTAWGPFFLQMGYRFLRAALTPERRHFTVSDLPQGPLPKPWASPVFESR
ncbi:metallo-beta-lactamase superfamily [Strigomonas culicis]|uniref:Metallo-beta-lactamase superfamily n=1 Tax=Strigomonas culicis TaxID=28005 RepID=S9UZW6_9TRYP|nr:metallo-beta-lactamase superfamily [Strigomonas culicis]|eukprot:EPY34309.1 metallo-beta-lactamase superfamily [Strigomonas culicis]